MVKAGLDAGMTCPNRDGKCGRGGCIYCEGSSFSFASPGSIREQLAAETKRIREKYPDALINAYFQSGTNTYAPVEKLRRLWDEALSFPEVAALSIATRADCLGADVLNLLEEYNGRRSLTVELGLQTVHDRTARRINRGYDYGVFLAAYEALKSRQIRTCIHMINGLPGETEKDMLESARVVGALSPGGVKLHLLYVTEGTALAGMWRRGEYQPMEKEAYIDLVCRQLRYFPEETVIERMTGDGDKRLLLAPDWSRDKRAVLGGIQHRLKENNWRQGDCFPCHAE